jgi:hypothetical protein
MGKSILLPGVKRHYGEEKEDDLDPHAEQIFRNDVMLAGVEDSRNDESKQEKEELVSRKDGALTPGVVCEDLEPEERDTEENWKTNSTSQFEAMLTLGKGAGNHIECHKVEALNDISKAREATKPTPGQCKRINDDWRKFLALRYREETKDL